MKFNNRWYTVTWSTSPRNFQNPLPPDPSERPALSGAPGCSCCSVRYIGYPLKGKVQLVLPCMCVQTFVILFCWVHTITLLWYSSILGATTILKHLPLILWFQQQPLFIGSWGDKLTCQKLNLCPRPYPADPSEMMCLVMLCNDLTPLRIRRWGEMTTYSSANKQGKGESAIGSSWLTYQKLECSIVVVNYWRVLCLRWTWVPFSIRRPSLAEILPPEQDALVGRTHASTLSGTPKNRRPVHLDWNEICKLLWRKTHRGPGLLKFAPFRAWTGRSWAPWQITHVPISKEQLI